MGISRRYLDLFLVVMVTGVNVVNLLPIVSSPYLGDDSWRESCLPGIMSLTGLNLAQICWETTKDYIRDGRWYPLVIYYHAIFCYLGLYGYKVGAVILIIANIIMTGYLIWIITRCKSTLVFVLLIAPAFFQLRFYHDPILSYYYLMQIELLLLQTSMVFFLKSIRGSGSAYLFLSVLFFGISLLIYEAFYPFCLIYAGVALIELGINKPSRLFKYSMPFIALTVFNFGISLAVRLHFGPTYDGTKLSLDLWAFLNALSKQAFSAIPLSYFLSSGQFWSLVDHVRDHLPVGLVIILPLWAALWLMAWNRFSQEAPCVRSNLMVLVFLGIGFFVFPSVVVSLAVKYQRELKWGLGYLPCYVSAFGIMMIVLFSFNYLRDQLQNSNNLTRKLVIVGMTFVGTILIGVNFVNNSMVVYAYNRSEFFHRDLIEHAISSGLIKGTPEGSFLVFGEPVRSWDQAAFYKMHSGLTFQIVKPPGFEMDWQLGSISYEEAFSEYATSLGNGEKCYDFQQDIVPAKLFTGYSAAFRKAQGVILDRLFRPNDNSLQPGMISIKYEANSGDSGYVVAANLKRLQPGRGNSLKGLSNSLRLYVKVPSNRTWQDLQIRGNWIDPNSMEKSGEFTFKENDLILKARDDFSKIFELPSGNDKQTLDPYSIVVIDNTPT